MIKIALSFPYYFIFRNNYRGGILIVSFARLKGVELLRMQLLRFLIKTWKLLLY